MMFAQPQPDDALHEYRDVLPHFGIGEMVACLGEVGVHQCVRLGVAAVLHDETALQVRQPEPDSLALVIRHVVRLGGRGRWDLARWGWNRPG